MQIREACVIVGLDAFCLDLCGLEIVADLLVQQLPLLVDR